MDDRLERALEFANYRATVENQKANIYRRFQTMSIMHYANGQFLSDQTTISFVSTLIDQGMTRSIIIDCKNRPVHVDNLNEFLDDLIENYKRAANEYSNEMQKLNKARSIKKALNWND